MRKRFVTVIVTFVLVPALLLAQGLPIKDGDSSTLLDVTPNKAVPIVHGKPDVASYRVGTTNAAITASGRSGICSSSMCFPTGSRKLK